MKKIKREDVKVMVRLTEGNGLKYLECEDENYIVGALVLGDSTAGIPKKSDVIELLNWFLKKVNISGLTENGKYYVEFNDKERGTFLGKIAVGSINSNVLNERLVYGPQNVFEKFLSGGYLW